MIVDLDTVKLEIGRDEDLHDGLIMRKIAEAHAIVFDYIKADIEDYNDSTGAYDLPVVIAAAVILVAAGLYERPDADALTDGVKNLLHRQRDPALA